MSQSTSSGHWREQGNGLYVSARDNLCPSIRKDRLRQAANCYYKAFNFSENEEEKVKKKEVSSGIVEEKIDTIFLFKSESPIRALPYILAYK